MARRRIPSDVAGVVDTFRKLGDAARRGLFVSEKRTKKEVQTAAKAADALSKKARRK